MLFSSEPRPAGTTARCHTSHPVAGPPQRLQFHQWVRAPVPQLAPQGLDISPVAELKVRSIEHPFVLDSTGNAFRDYLNNAQGIEDGVLIITDFTVFK